MELEEYLDYLKTFLKDYMNKAHASGYIIGLSGGIDSAVCAYLMKEAVGKDHCYGLILPCFSNPDDENDAKIVAQGAGIDYSVISLNKTYVEIKQSIISSFKVDNTTKSYELALANTKVRLRMTTIYAVGQMKNLLVVGTDNLPETYTGYFTKHGDGAADILPLRYLTKGEVRRAARILGIDERIVQRRPSAGLIEGVYDELEMGVTYEELDTYLLGGKIADKQVETIERLHRNSEHKRNPAVTPKEYIR